MATDAILLRTTLESKQTQHTHVRRKTCWQVMTLKATVICVIFKTAATTIYIEYQRLDRLRDRKKLGWCWNGSVCLVWHEKCRIHWFHARWTGKRAHEPVVDAVFVIGVNAWKIAQWVANYKFSHAYHTLLGFLAVAAIIYSTGQMVNQSNSLCYLYLLLLCQLCCCTTDVWTGMVYWNSNPSLGDLVGRRGPHAPGRRLAVLNALGAS